MDRIPIRSTNIKEVGYDVGSSTLEVMFSDGGIYRYFGVPESIYDGLVRAPSAGQYFHRMIRDKYRFSECRSSRRRSDMNSEVITVGPHTPISEIESRKRGPVHVMTTRYSLGELFRTLRLLNFKPSDLSSQRLGLLTDIGR